MARMFARRGLLGAALGASLLVTSHTGAHASGVAVAEQGRGLGNAYAGASASAEDASTVWWNPAGMTRFRRTRAAVATSLIVASGEYRDSGDSTDLLGGPLTGTNPRDGGAEIPVPSAFVVMPMSPRARLGIGLNVPFGLGTDYGREWIGRYHATESDLAVANVGVACALELGCLSIGGGFDLQHASVVLAQAIDFGSIGAANQVPGAVPQGSDGSIHIEADDWSLGMNLGLLYQVSPSTRVGVTWRSGVTHDLEGDARFTVPGALAPFVPAGGRFADTDASARVRLPQTLAFGVHHDLSCCWSVMADVRWTEWSVLQEVDIEYDNPAEPNSVLDLQWSDTWRFSVGAIYRPNSRWSFRAGVAYDESPVPDATRTPRIPGNDRIWASFGVGYRVNRQMEIDLGYTHLFIEDGRMDLADPGRGTLSGSTNNVVDILGVQVSLSW